MLNKQSVFFILFFLYLEALSAQNSPPPPPTTQTSNFSYNRLVSLKELTYSQAETEFPVIKNDMDDMPYVPVGVSHWSSDQPTTNYPITYSSGSKIKISAKFILACEGLDASNIRLQPFVEENGYLTPLKFPIQKPTVTPLSIGKYELLYKTAASANALPSNKIIYCEHFAPIWQISYDRGNNWELVPLTQCSNELYVTWKKPQPESEYYKYFHTLFELTCKKLNGLIIQDENDLADQLWVIFKRGHWQGDVNSNLYRKKDGKLLKYYEFYSDDATNTGLLLNKGAGQCGSFTSLFRDMLRTHGKYLEPQSLVSVTGNPTITTANSENAIRICNRDINISDVYFMIKEWSFTGPTSTSSSNNCSEIPYRMGTKKNGQNEPNQVGALSFHKTFLDVHDQQGISGQNSVNPNSWFWNHIIVKINNTYYDPSYGVIYQSENDMVQNIGGWSVVLQTVTELQYGSDINGDGFISPTLVFDIWGANPNRNTVGLKFN